MLVIQVDSATLRLIAQPAHARMAGALAARWRRPRAIPEAVWPRLVDAVGVHDDGWHEAERSPALDERGRPHSFKTLPVTEHVRIWRRGVRSAMAADTYAGLIVALHARWLYTALMRPANADETDTAQSFVDELDQYVDVVIGTLTHGGEAERRAIEPHALMAARRLVGALDGLSLMLCGALPFGPFPEPVTFGGSCERVTFSAAADGAHAMPWPFADDMVTVTTSARDVPDRVYADADELTSAMHSATPMTLTFHLCPGAQ